MAAGLVQQTVVAAWDRIDTFRDQFVRYVQMQFVISATEHTRGRHAWPAVTGFLRQPDADGASARDIGGRFRSSRANVLRSPGQAS